MESINAYLNLIGVNLMILCEVEHFGTLAHVLGE